MAAVARSGVRGAPAGPGKAPGREALSRVPAPASPEHRSGGHARATAARRHSLRVARRRGIVSRRRAVVAGAPALVDRLLRGRVWVALITALLTGIVFLNVALLELNGRIARTDLRVSELRGENAVLRLRVARLGSSERIRRAAEARGFVLAPPGQVGYLALRPGAAERAARALERWRSPSPAAAPPTSATP
jgi:hypothetical protein